MHNMRKGDTPVPVARHAKPPSLHLVVSKKLPKNSVMADVGHFAKEFKGKYKTEFERSFKMLTPDQQAATKRMDPEDANHFYVFSLAFRAGFTKVAVTDSPPDIQNPNTLYLTERMIKYIGDEFRAHKTPLIVTSRYYTSFSHQHKENQPQRPSEEPAHGVALLAL